MGEMMRTLSSCLVILFVLIWKCSFPSTMDNSPDIISISLQQKNHTSTYNRWCFDLHQCPQWFPNRFIPETILLRCP
ncbi:hypothetical protein KC19_1G251000 [Ceratodon purpureus]|uniref:Secreted protein n=1 Tax=Ceratodon purpureus TaxID=3225 RepID=A0A8T0JCI7_CERPU|nr:hypothetical protein KC19_1G251000 [Ceratodon purpureus]